MKKDISLFIILLSVALSFLLSSCCCTEETILPATQPFAFEEENTVADINDAVVEESASAVKEHVVKKGECLWWIAEYEDIYNDPFMWPIIYKANKESIGNPDMIYPEQTFVIPREGYTMTEIKEARRRAGAPYPYTPPDGSVLPID